MMLRAPAVSLAPARTQRCARPVLVRADPPQVRQTREFREGDSEVKRSDAGGVTQRPDGLYADLNAGQPRQKSNLSPEMKARLRKEYTGFGGSENTVASAVEEEDFDDFSLPMPPRRPFVVAAATVETLEKPVVTTTAAPAPTATPAPATPAPAAAASAAPTAAPAPARAPVVEARPAGATVLDAKASTSAPSSAGPSSATAAAAAKAGASKFVVDENENLKATPEQKAWTWVSMAMMGTTFMNATQQIEGPGDVVAFGAAVFAAYVLADLGTGIYHWGVDNYGDGETPVFGRQIAAFQGHHQRPWTITQREFENNMHQVFGPASYPAMGLMVLSPTMPLAWNAWASSFLWLVCMSQQFHAWSHMKKSELPAAVVWLQEAGILVSRKMHGAHHLPPFEANYAIVSGWTNPLLDRIGFYRRLEKIVLDWTGVAPRCSEEVPEEWREQARPEAPASK